MTKCERCSDEYTLRHGDDPTPHCDHCAHELVDELRADVERLRETLRACRDQAQIPTIAALIDAALQPAATKGEDHE